MSIYDSHQSCINGHLRIEDGNAPDGTRLWHCAKCGAGVRLPVRRDPEPQGWWSKLWSRIWPPFCFLIFISGFTAGLMAEEVPAWVLRGIAAVETGTHWTDTGAITGTWSRSSTGDLGPWGMSPAVLIDLRQAAHAARVQRDPVFAESLARRWLLHLHSITGDWLQTCAAWRAGIGRRHRAWARDYAERASNYGHAY